MRFLADADSRGVSKVVGNLLLVVIVVLLAASVSPWAFGFLDGFGVPVADAAFSYEEKPAGLQMTAEHVGSEKLVQLNGETVYTFDKGDTGESVLLPTAPGDRVTVLARDEEMEVLVDKRIDSREEMGDFIAYYQFDSDPSGPLVDKSGNGNNGTVHGQPGEVPDGWRFDGSDDSVEVGSLSAAQNVSGFTIAVSYNQRDHDGTGDYTTIDQLIEHRTGTGNEWFLETKPTDSNSYGMHYAVNYPDEVIESESQGGEYDPGGEDVVVGTYDGANYVLYMNGNRVQSGSYNRTVEMGELRIARDFEDTIQYFDGDIYEIRLYYHALEDEEITSITEAMN